MGFVMDCYEHSLPMDIPFFQCSKLCANGISMPLKIISSLYSFLLTLIYSFLFHLLHVKYMSLIELIHECFSWIVLRWHVSQSLIPFICTQKCGSVEVTNIAVRSVSLCAFVFQVLFHLQDSLHCSYMCGKQSNSLESLCVSKIR